VKRPGTTGIYTCGAAPIIPEARPALVKWHDAHPDTDGWINLADVDPTPRVAHTVAWVLPWGTKPDHLSVAMDHDPAAERWNGVHHIPWSWVARIDFLD